MTTRPATAEEAPVYMVECELATLEYVRSLKRTVRDGAGMGKGRVRDQPRHELSRHESIAKIGLDSCRAFVSVEVARRIRCFRVAEALAPR